MSRFFIVSVTLIALSIVHVGQSQLRYTTIANSSTMTNYGIEYQMTVQDKNNILVTFKRGSGTTVADREIKIASSADAGHNFTETDITISNNTGTENPLISSTKSSIVALYCYDSSGTTRACRARSTDGGSTFSLSTIYSSHINSSLETFISDGISKYYVGDQNYLFSSIDNGLTFKEMKLPSDMSTAYWARWAATSNYLWVAYNKSVGDSIYIYRSSDNGNTYQFITQFYNDFPYQKLFTCSATNDQLLLSYVHEEVGMYYLKTRIIVGTNVGSEKTVLASTSSIYDKPIIKKTVNRIFIRLSNLILQSSDSGNNWSRSSDATTEMTNNSNLNMFIPLDDTTIYLHTDNILTGSLRQIIVTNWKWTDIPITDLKDNALITNSSTVDIGWWNRYVETPTYRLQMSNSADFSQIIFDTLGKYHTYVPMKGRFQANGEKYYYRVRGEDGSYATSWSQTKAFYYGSTITNQPELILPVNAATIDYPNVVNFQWNLVANADQYIFHVSTNINSSDTLAYYDDLSDKIAYFPWKDGKVLNGTFYWRVRGFEYLTGSSGPWSTANNFSYNGAPTSLIGHANTVPLYFSLSQNYPNPFNPSTTINYSVPKKSYVTLIIYDALGREVTTLINEEKAAGNYTVEFSAKNLASGIYIYQIRAGEFIQSKKLLLLR